MAMKESSESDGGGDRRPDGADRVRDSSDAPDPRVDRGQDGGDHWRQAVDHDGRSVATVEGSYADEKTFQADRADAVEGPRGDRGAAAIAESFKAEGVSVRAAGDARLPEGGTRRDITDELETATARPERATERPDIAALHPADYVPATADDHAKVRDLRGESADPHRWAKSINPGHDAEVAALQRGEPIARLNRVTNCTESSRAVQDTLDGHPRAAAAGTYEGYDRIDAWAGKTSEAATFDGVGSRLAKPGDSAVLVATFDGGRGHAFNAVNIDGKVSYVDGQTGEVSDWPPRLANDTRTLRAWYFEK